MPARGLWRRFRRLHLADLRRFGVGCVALSSVLVGLLLFGQLAAHRTAADVQASAVEITRLGEKRALVQHILYLSDVSAVGRPPGHCERLSAKIDRLARAQDDRFTSPRLGQHAASRSFTFGGLSFDGLIQTFLADARRLAGEPDARDAEQILARMSEMARATIPAAFADLTRAVTYDMSGGAARQAVLRDAVFAAAILVMALGTALLFLPAQLASQQALARLRRHVSALNASRREARTRNRELERLRGAAEYDALHDSLTDLPNRRAFETRLAKLAEAAGAQGGGLAVLHLDLDRFKAINDTFGHAAGDAALKQVADVLRAERRPGDVVARTGGDEFMLAAPCDDDPSALQDMAARLVTALSRPMSFDGASLRFGASVGVAWTPAPTAGGVIDMAALLGQADKALYDAKRAGGGCVRLAIALAKRAAV